MQHSLLGTASPISFASSKGKAVIGIVDNLQHEEVQWKLPPHLFCISLGYGVAPSIDGDPGHRNISTQKA